jgi:hypothetical protein
MHECEEEFGGGFAAAVMVLSSLCLPCLPLAFLTWIQGMLQHHHHSHLPAPLSKQGTFSPAPAFHLCRSQFPLQATIISIITSSKQQYRAA